MSLRLLARAGVLTATTVLVGVALAGPASAHVSVTAADAVQGGYTTATFKVPNEKDDADTTKVEVNLPTDTPVASVSLRPTPGWTATAEKSKLPTPVTTDDGQVTEAITKITWTAGAGTGIKPGQFQQFDISLGPLPKADQVVFKALQTYSDGEVVRWIEVPADGAAEPANPAPVLKLAAAGAEGEDAAAAPAAAESSEDTGGPDWLALAGVALGLAGLVAGLLAYRRANTTPSTN